MDLTRGRALSSETGEHSGVTVPKGWRAAGISCGIKKNGATDLALIVSDSPATAAGVFTTNLVKGAPVRVTKEHLKSSTVRGVVVNSGNSNVMTEHGVRDATRMAEAAAKVIGADCRQLLVASTGVIGTPLPIEKIESAMPQLAGALAYTGGGAAARAIMTTDLAPKEAEASVMIGKTRIRVGGCAKGSGMIHPNMATMLAFVTMDVAVSKRALAALVKRVNEATFAKITVDGDTSTSDMLILMANGAAGAPAITTPSGSRFESLAAAVGSVCERLAKMVVRDGEGATKFVTVKVTGARSGDDARRCAMSIAKSNLVKTALFGEDPNWGRALAAAGYSGARFDPMKTSLALCGVPVFVRGRLNRPDWESTVAPKMKAREVTIQLDLGAGKASAEVWTCDLSYDYVRINAEYRS
ncbi:MAG: bifunctional glutamate N-acetyltransferase/amino-acid acetyltransferase ArgJ [Nitrospinae bacterium]|nr:bifunctional glutamate N-acetyltransferase/amino-acid acetyltransferase ArgJ [Nitrospinota bacterium]